MMPLRKRLNFAFGLVIATALLASFGGGLAFLQYDAAGRGRSEAALSLGRQEDDLLSKVALEVHYARSYVYTGDENYILKYQLVNQDVAVAYQLLNAGASRVQADDLPALQRLALLHSEFGSGVAELIALRRAGDSAGAIRRWEAEAAPLVEEMLAAVDQTHAALIESVTTANRLDADRARWTVYLLLVVFGTGCLIGLAMISRSLRPMLDQLEVLTGVMERSKASPLYEIIPAPALPGGGLTDLMDAYNQLANRQAELRKRNLDFLEVLCHKMRSPLASVLGYSVLLADPKASLAESDRQKFVQTITRQTEALAQLVDDVLRAARLEDDQNEMVFTPVRVETLLSDVIQESRHQSGRAITLEDGNGPVVVPGDALRLREMFLSLIDNALKVAPPNEPVTVRLEKNERKRQVDIVIRDRGQGLSPGEQAAMLEQFGRLRAKGNSARGTQPNGLGMYIASRIVQAHHGHIEFESQPGKGSALKVVLPLGSPEVQNG